MQIVNVNTVNVNDFTTQQGVINLQSSILI